MSLQLLKYFQVETQLNLVKQMKDTKERKKIEKEIEQEYTNQKNVKKEDVKNLEIKLSSILDLIENTKKDISGQGMSLNLSKKIIKETDFDLFFSYINCISINKETQIKANEILTSLVSILDYNNKTNNSIFFEYSSIKITSLFMKLNNHYLNLKNNSNISVLIEILSSIQLEIEQLEIFNYSNILSTNIFESGEGNLSSLLNQIPVLKCYLMNWYMLLFVSFNNQEEDNLRGNFDDVRTTNLICLEKYLELISNPEYFKHIKSFDYLVNYATIMYIISKKEKFRAKINELSRDYSEELESSRFIQNLYGEFDLDLLLKQREGLIKQIKEDCFLSSFTDTFEVSSSLMIIQVYISLYSSISIKPLLSLKLEENQSVKDYVVYSIKNKYSEVEVEEKDDEISYNIIHDAETNDHLVKTKMIKTLSKSLWAHLESS